MKYCPYCGAELSDGAASFCMECGKSLPAMDGDRKNSKEESISLQKRTEKKQKKPRKRSEKRRKKPTVNSLKARVHREMDMTGTMMMSFRLTQGS